MSHDLKGSCFLVLGADRGVVPIALRGLRAENTIPIIKEYTLNTRGLNIMI